MSAESESPRTAASIDTSRDHRQISVVTLNVWGLKFISEFRNERMSEIGRQLAMYDPVPQIVGLQECFCKADFDLIHAATKSFLPYGKYFYSGIFGSGLAILSKWPIEESSMTGYTVNGLPWAFWRGDWYVGKGYAQVRIRIPPEGAHPEELIDVFNTHLHAPYHPPDRDFYYAHRLTQAWQLSKAIRSSVTSTEVSLVIAVGDFNSQPDSIPYKLLTKHGLLRDSWLEANPSCLTASGEQSAYTAFSAISQFGTTCDSSLNTWRWSKALRKQAHKGKPVTVPNDSPNPGAKRLDYVFYANGGAATANQTTGMASNSGGLAELRGAGGAGNSAPRSNGPTQWSASSSHVGLTDLHPKLNCSLSDHFSVETVLTRRIPRSVLTTVNPNLISAQGENGATAKSNATATHEVSALSSPDSSFLDKSDYETILHHIRSFAARERRVRTFRLAHFAAEIGITIGCLVAVWFVPFGFISFILMLVAVLGFGMGLLDGLMGGLFVNSELSGLAEFEWDVRAKLEKVTKRT